MKSIVSFFAVLWMYIAGFFAKKSASRPSDELPFDASTLDAWSRVVNAKEHKWPALLLFYTRECSMFDSGIRLITRDDASKLLLDAALFDSIMSNQIDYVTLKNLQKIASN